MPPTPSIGRADPSAGFSLVEVTIAIGIAVFCLVTLAGLLTVGLQSNRAAASQSAATAILSTVIADLRATAMTSPPGQAASSPQFGIAIPANPVSASTAATLYFTSEGQASTAPAARDIYRLTVTFLPNGSSSRTATFADLKVSWPSSAAPAGARGSVENFVALDRN